MAASAMDGMIIMNIEARVATQPWSCSYNNLNNIAVLHRVIPPNLLTNEAC